MQENTAPDQEYQPEPGELEPVVNQTRFAEDVVIADVGSRAEADTAASKRKTLYFFGGGVAMVVLLFFIVIAQRMPTAMPLELSASPTPLPTPAQVFTPLERLMQVLADDIERADPVDADVGFPPVNFTLRLEDASEIQLNRR